MAFAGDFQPVLAKQSKHFSLTNALSIGVDAMQRNFAGMRTDGSATLSGDGWKCVVSTRTPNPASWRATKVH